MINAIVDGVLLGGVYALLACGLSLMFGVMRIINLAHGSLALVGAYMTLLVVEHTSLGAYAALVIVLPGALVVGYVLQRTMLERSRRAGELVPLLTTFGLLIVIGNLLEHFFSPDTKSLSAGGIGTSSLHLTGSITVGWFDVLTLGVAVVLIGGLQMMLSYTQFGREIRATSVDADTAELMGVNARGVYARATAIAVATAALAGVFYAMRGAFDPTQGANELLYAFEAVVIGGLGSLWGTLVGGIVLGVAQTVGAHIEPRYFDLAGHVVFLAVLIVRAIALSQGIRLWGAESA